MNRDEMIKSAKDTVSRMDTDIKDIRLAHAERFFAGTVIVLDYLLRDQKRRDYVYFDDSGAEIHSQNFEAFLKSFAEKTDQSLTTMLYLFGGVLALIVVGTVCYLGNHYRESSRCSLRCRHNNPWLLLWNCRHKQEGKITY